MKWLKVKCDAGADFVITQLFYDMDAFEKWVKECRAAGTCDLAVRRGNANDRYHYTDHSWCHAYPELLFFQTPGQIDGMPCSRYYHAGS